MIGNKYSLIFNEVKNMEISIIYNTYVYLATRSNVQLKICDMKTLIDNTISLYEKEYKITLSIKNSIIIANVDENGYAIKFIRNKDRSASILPLYVDNYITKIIKITWIDYLWNTLVNISKQDALTGIATI